MNIHTFLQYTIAAGAVFLATLSHGTDDKSYSSHQPSENTEVAGEMMLDAASEEKVDFGAEGEVAAGVEVEASDAIIPRSFLREVIVGPVSDIAQRVAEDTERKTGFTLFPHMAEGEDVKGLGFIGTNQKPHFIVAVDLAKTKGPVLLIDEAGVYPDTFSQLRFALNQAVGEINAAYHEAFCLGEVARTASLLADYYKKAWGDAPEGDTKRAAGLRFKIAEEEERRAEEAFAHAKEHYTTISGVAWEAPLKNGVSELEQALSEKIDYEELFTEIAKSSPDTAVAARALSASIEARSTATSRSEAAEYLTQEAKEITKELLQRGFQKNTQWSSIESSLKDSEELMLLADMLKFKAMAEEARQMCLSNPEYKLSVEYFSSTPTPISSAKETGYHERAGWRLLKGGVLLAVVVAILYLARRRLGEEKK